MNCTNVGWGMLAAPSRLYLSLWTSLSTPYISGTLSTLSHCCFSCSRICLGLGLSRLRAQLDTGFFNWVSLWGPESNHWTVSWYNPAMHTEAALSNSLNPKSTCYGFPLHTWNMFHAHDVTFPPIGYCHLSHCWQQTGLLSRLQVLAMLCIQFMCNIWPGLWETTSLVSLPQHKMI